MSATSATDLMDALAKRLIQYVTHHPWAERVVQLGVPLVAIAVPLGVLGVVGGRSFWWLGLLSTFALLATWTWLWARWRNTTADRYAKRMLAGEIRVTPAVRSLTRDAASDLFRLVGELGFTDRGDLAVVDENGPLGQTASTACLDDVGGTLATISSVVTVLTTELADGRTLVTQTGPIRLPLPGTINQSVETRDPTIVVGVHRDGLRVLAGRGVAPSPERHPVDACLLRFELATQSWLRRVGYDEVIRQLSLPSEFPPVRCTLTNGLAVHGPPAD